MIKPVKASGRSVNGLLLYDFLQLVSDEALGDVFYAPDERDAATAFTEPRNHPLHPEFLPRNHVRRGLLSAEPLPPAFDLVALTKTQQERIAKHWKTVCSHEIYQYLSADLNFQSAYRTFENLRRRPRAAEGYKHPYAQFRYVGIACQHVGSFLGDVHPSPTAKQRRSAISHIDALLKDMEVHGVGLGAQGFRNYDLRRALHLLKNDLKQKVRKPRHDRAKAFRDFDKQLAFDLLMTFDVASPEIVKHLARAAGSTLDERTIDSHVEAVRNAKIVG